MTALDFWRAEHAPTVEYEDIPEEWQGDSNRGCADCPDDECTGHCASCYYRPV